MEVLEKNGQPGLTHMYKRRLTGRGRAKEWKGKREGGGVFSQMSMRSTSVRAQSGRYEVRSGSRGVQIVFNGLSNSADGLSFGVESLQTSRDVSGKDASGLG